MVDAIWPSISSDLDETVAQLDQLHAASHSRRLENRRKLEQIVAGLAISTGSDDPAEAPAERRERFEDRRPPSSDPAPFVALPTRTTHGGPFGPKVRDKLIAEALGKAGW